MLVLQEVATATGANILLNALNANGQEYARSTFFDEPRTDQILYYRTSKVDLVGDSFIRTDLRSIGEYELSVDGSLFNVYNVHLKASQGQENEDLRFDEATILRDHFETLPADREFILAGDFNIYTNTEAAYEKLTESEANNDGRVEDLLPPNLIGNWHTNPDFASVHTQSPRTAQFGGGAASGLDDRFDMIFTSFGLRDGLGLEYVPDSQFVLGNDGQHFDQSILSGTNNSTSQAVLQALHDGSDHLPVVAEFQVESPIGVTIFESGSSTSVSEDGATDTYELVLDSVPTANVTVAVTPGSQVDIGNGAGVSRNLTFTPANALTAQTISISAIDDADVEGLHFETISHSVTSSDANYDGLAVDSVEVSIADNDGSATSFALLNEVYANIPGPDNNFEYVEILADPLSTLTDLWLLEIEGDGAVAGIIDNAQNLSSITAGANGLILLGDGYPGSNPWGSEVSSDTTAANLEGETIENGSLSFLLVQGFTGAVGDDVDTNNDGSFDSTPWTAVLDDVGWSDGGSSDRVFANAVLPFPQEPSHAATRIFGDRAGGSASSWFNGSITGSVTYEQGSSNLPPDAVITPGDYNFGATAPTLDDIQINTGESQRSRVDQLQISFDSLVDLDSDAFTLIQRSDVDGVATGTIVATSFSTLDVGGETVVTVSFDSLTRNASGALVDGNYELTVDGSKVRTQGTDLTLGADIVYGDVASDNFFAFYGETTGNRTVNIFDLLDFRDTYLAQAGGANFDASLDFGDDGVVNVFDLLQYRANYLETLPFV